MRISDWSSDVCYSDLDYIFLADQDDIWLRGKVSTMMAHLRYADLVVSDCAVVDERLNTITESFFALRRSRNGLMHNIMRNSSLGCCLALRRPLLHYALPFPALVPMGSDERRVGKGVVSTCK